MFADFLSTGDRRWLQILQQTPHDFYHLPEYVSLAARHEGGRPCAFYAECEGSALLVPLLMRSLPADLQADSGLCDVATPYGYPGPILAGNSSESVLEEMLQAFVRVSRERRVVSAFWRIHPLLKFPLGALQHFGVLVYQGNTVFIDLLQPAEQLWQSTSNNHRRHINRLKKDGFSVVQNDWSHFEAFIKIYYEAMDRVGANRFYFFPEEYFFGLKNELCHRIDFWTVISPTGELAAAGLFSSTNGIVEYHLGAPAASYLDCSPLKLLISEVRFWAKNTGNRVMHLGGGVGGGNDSLYDFKSRFSPLKVPFHTFRSILQPTVYSELSMKRHGDGINIKEIKSEFFPAYRTPR